MDEGPKISHVILDIDYIISGEFGQPFFILGGNLPRVARYSCHV
jgi:hypothetical protein